MGQETGVGASRSQRRRRAALTLAACTLAWLTTAPPRAESGRPTNILWIVVDTTRVDRLGVYGNEDGLTPNLDALAARGTVWTNAYAQGPDTMLSVSSYMTSRYRLDNGMDFSLNKLEYDYHPLSDAVTTLAEALEGTGLRREGVIANAVISGRGAYDLNVHQGFQAWHHTTDAGVVSEGIKRLEDLQEQPFLLYLHLFGPHVPNAPAADFDIRHPELAGVLDEIATPDLYRDLSTGERVFTDAENAVLRALYDDALAVADAQVGEVLDALERLGLADDTLVVLTSDHGEVLGEVTVKHPRWGHSFALLEQLLHVPLILAGPGVPRGLTSDDLVELIDLAPTLAASQGVEPLPEWGWQGRSLWSAEPPRTAVLADRGGKTRHESGARTLHESAILYHSVSKGDPYRFFDLDAVQGELQPLKPAARRPAHEQLRTLLQAYVDAAQAPPLTDNRNQPTEADLQRLRDLGYLH